MNTAQALNRQEKKNHKQRNRHRRQIKSNGVRKEPVLCPVSPLFITDRAYTIQASAQFRARNLTSQSSCRLYLCLQALLIFHIYFISSPGSLPMVCSRGERVFVDYLLGKSDGQLPKEPVFINKRSVYGICPSIRLWPRHLHLSQSNRLKIHLQIISSSRPSSLSRSIWDRTKCNTNHSPKTLFLTLFLIVVRSMPKSSESAAAVRFRNHSDVMNEEKM